MATTTVTPDQDTIVSEIDMAAPAERVFRAIWDPAEVRKHSPAIDVFEMEARVGGRWRLEMRQPYRGQPMIRHEGEVLECDPPRLLVYTWTANFHNDPNHRSIVRWELTPTKAGTHVKVTHSGLASEPQACKDYASGWPGVLEVLKKFAEK